MAPNSTFASRGLVRPSVAASLIGICALALTACGSSEASDGAAGPDSSSAAKTNQVTDATGTSVKVPAAPERVVALSEMDLDAALALGVKPVGLTAGRGQKGAPATSPTRRRASPWWVRSPGRTSRRSSRPSRM